VSLLTILITAVGLAMDAVAVSVTSGLTLTEHRQRNALKMAAWFGGFQALMPAVGFALGVAFRDWVAAVDHWIAFVLLAAIGGKMIHEALTSDGDEPRRTNPFAVRTLAALAIATSIDALAVGISFSLLEIGLVQTVAIIGVVTFVLSYLAVLFGRRVGERFSAHAELAGGVVLIGIGLEILVEHTLLD
jgi:putative Mn2+ efflux pump MntP